MKLTTVKEKKLIDKMIKKVSKCSVRCITKSM